MAGKNRGCRSWNLRLTPSNERESKQGAGQDYKEVKPIPSDIKASTKVPSTTKVPQSSPVAPLIGDQVFGALGGCSHSN